MTKDLEIRLVKAMSVFAQRKVLPPNEKIFVSHIYNKVIKGKEEITKDQEENALNLIKKWMVDYSDFKKN